MKDLHDSKAVQRELSVEQDLEIKPIHTGLQDEKDFEAWADGMRNDLEDASLERYLSVQMGYF